MALSVGAFARIRIDIDLASTQGHCDRAATAMGPLHTITSNDSWAREFLRGGGQQPIIYEHARTMLQRACDRLRLWAKPSPIMGDDGIPAARASSQSPRSGRASAATRNASDLAPFLDDPFEVFQISSDVLRSVMHFATTPVLPPPRFSNSTLSRQPRGLGVAAVAGAIGLVGGATLLTAVVSMLFGDPRLHGSRQ